ncbi:DUF6503 family protein [Polaribacter sp.]|uniref:DUF6503 family protein n=1 Tax=Polaribacter sp. TaxID=1920175 RepID=UPI0025E58B3D|nr:DUF6503 family protein [Polaribacter sp.]
MKKIAIVFILAITIVSCKKQFKKETEDKNKTEIKSEVNKNIPKELAKVFKTHGGLATWNSLQVLSFNKGEEAHTADLKSRKTVVNSPKYSLGFNGSEVWLDEENEGDYKGNPEFYYNLYFYFYAMPFVLADDGIIYEKADSISFEGIEYPGFKISYKANIGTSPDDNYIVYYNPKNFQMEWLAYTVTFNSKEPSNRYNLIKYSKWENVNDLILPKEITWYNKDDKGMPTEPSRPSKEFTLPLASKAKLADSFFEKPKK